MIIRALGNKTLPIYGNGENVRDWLHVEDHATALLTVLDRGQIGSQYNIRGDNEARNIDIVQMICAELDEFQPTQAPHSQLITFVEDRPGHDQRYAIDASKIKSELGWAPSVTLEDGIRKTVRWYLENQTWWSKLMDSHNLSGRLGLKK